MKRHQALHLKTAAEQPDDHARGRRRAASAGAAQREPGAQPGVVEAHLGDAAAPGDLERSAHQRLVDAVGGLADPAHRVQRQLSAVRDEVHDRAELSIGRARQQVQIAWSHRGLERAPCPSRSRSGAIAWPATRARGGRSRARARRRGHARRRRRSPSRGARAGAPTGAACVRAALQRERGRVDDRLLADAQRAEAEAAVARQVAGGCPPQHDPPAAGPREREKFAQHRATTTRRAPPDRLRRRRSRRSPGKPAPRRRRTETTCRA